MSEQLEGQPPSAQSEDQALSEPDGQGGPCSRCRHHGVVVRYIWACTGLVTSLTGFAGVCYQFLS